MLITLVRKIVLASTTIPIDTSQHVRNVIRSETTDLNSSASNEIALKTLKFWMILITLKCSRWTKVLK